MSACAITPIHPPNRFTAPGCPGCVTGIVPVPTQIIPCCIASVTRYISVEYLSPLICSEQVKPPASLSFQPSVAQTFALASAKVLNGADAPPMYVGAPNTIASAAASASQPLSSIASTSRDRTATPGSEAAPSFTASASLRVCPYPE